MASRSILMIQATTHVSFKGWNLEHAKGSPKQAGVGSGVAPKAKGNGRRMSLTGDLSTFARPLVPHESIMRIASLNLDASSFASKSSQIQE